MELYEKLRKMHILLIDDDEWIRDAMQLFFESEGCPIKTLETAEEGGFFHERRSTIKNKFGNSLKGSFRGQKSGSNIHLGQPFYA